jgi:uncharacterized protein (DUF362 family)
LPVSAFAEIRYWLFVFERVIQTSDDSASGHHAPGSGVQLSRGVIALTGGEADIPAVAIVEDAALPASGKLAAALDRAGLWRVLRRAVGNRPPDALRILIKPEMAGFAAGSPAATDPALVEELVDLLHDRGFSDVAVAGTCDSSAVWADNRDLHAIADLLGYRYETAKRRSYEIADLADEQEQAAFPPGCALHGCAISRLWLDADIRIVFSKSRADEASGYALCLDTLIDVLPLPDKDLHYRRRRHPGDVAAALLDLAPVQFCLIDGIVGAHGDGGRRAPVAIDTGTVIAASDIVLADLVGAMKMGLDAAVSPTFARVIRRHPIPQRYTVAGALGRWADWRNVPSFTMETIRVRQQAEALDRLVQPWLQCLDPELFPLKHPLDARLNAALAPFFAEAANAWLLDVANGLLGWIGLAIEAYRTMFAKDSLRQCSVPLGIDVDAVRDESFAALAEELLELEPVAAAAPQVSPELCWQESDHCIVFRYTRSLPIGFELFTRRVDIARTIQFMNDYLGGVLVPLAHDGAGRPVRQAERNIYLPQPNYLALYQGKPIDVSKLEVVQYEADRHRLFWKTIKSENASATHDDGIASFERTFDGTRIVITGRQQFILPRFWEVFDPGLVPGLKPKLVTHAYQTFFDRTIANFEALVEGRDIRIGRPVDEPAGPMAEKLMPWLQRLAEIAAPILARLAEQQPQGPRGATDPDGFIHVVQSNASPTELDRWAAELARFVEGFNHAFVHDLMRRSVVP